MSKKQGLSRRKFIHSSSLSIVGLSTIEHKTPFIPVHSSLELTQVDDTFFIPKDGDVGLLYSQIGYEPGYPLRIVFRAPKPDLLPKNLSSVLESVNSDQKYRTLCNYWGEIWQNHWWVIEFTEPIAEGTYSLDIRDQKVIFWKETGIIVRDKILWESTLVWSSVDMLERRSHFTGVGAGWQDAGTLWVESPAQSSMVMALAELLEIRKEHLDANFISRVYRQIICGCDYLILTQKRATELGFPRGAMSHDVLKHEKDILPHDAAKAIVALIRAVRLLPDSFAEKKKIYEKAAKDAYHWLFEKAKPMGDYGFVRLQRGIPANTNIPKTEWPTRDLLGKLAVCIEMIKYGDTSAEFKAIELANQIVARQIPKRKNIEGFYGNFYEFSSLPHAETSWSHGIVPSPSGTQFGTDMGGIFPNYLIPLIELITLISTHQFVQEWKKCIHNFTYGYLIPSCKANPFLIIPQGIFKNEGPIWFCGTFHGTNCIYGYTAALALELKKIIPEPFLDQIAYGNLQWIAGLNAGITHSNVQKGSVVFSVDIPEGKALPASMICHIGKRWAGSWFQTRGVVCNGFSTGEQFKYDTEPKKVNDGPFSFTDEDWIPHSAAWLAGLMRL